MHLGPGTRAFPGARRDMSKRPRYCSNIDIWGPGEPARARPQSMKWPRSYHKSNAFHAPAAPPQTRSCQVQNAQTLHAETRTL